MDTNLERIFRPDWTSEQLLVLGRADREAQRDVEHMRARLALVNHAGEVDLGRLRSMVSRILGSIADTYWIVAALQLAYLAMAHPQSLTDAQFSLMLAPLEAAEQAAAAAASSASAPASVPVAVAA